MTLYCAPIIPQSLRDLELLADSNSGRGDDGICLYVVCIQEPMMKRYFGKWLAIAEFWSITKLKEGIIQ